MHKLEFTGKKTGRKIACWLLALLLAAASLLYAAPHAQAKDYSTVRIKLSNANDGTLNITANGTYSVKENGAALPKNILVSNAGGSLSITNKDTGVVIYTGKSARFVRASNQNGAAGTLRMFSQNNGNCNYLGDLNITADPDGKSFAVINILPMEHYLYGVVAYEMNDSWPLETLKAQAVAARGYAAGKISTSGTYDLVDTPQDQVYKGYNSKYQNVKKAVDATKGQVMTYDGKIFLPYYGASNGGQTELASNVWKETRGYTQMKDDPYDLRNTTSPKQTIFFPKTVSSSTPLDPKLESFLKTLVAPELKNQGYSTYSDQIEILGISNLKGTDRKYPSPSRNFTHAGATVRVRAMTGGGDGIVIDKATSKPTKPNFSVVGQTANGQIYADDAGNLYDEASMQDALDRYSTSLDEWQNGSASLEDSGKGFSGSGTEVSVDVSFRIYDLKDKDMAYRLFTNDNLIFYTIEDTTGGANILNMRFGHGVGMSQRGAQQMGKEGKTYKDILNFYYKNIKFTTLDYSSPVVSGSTESENVGFPEGLDDSSATVTATSQASVAMYDQPGGTKFSTLKKGVRVNVLGQTGNYFLIQTEAGSTGFALADNLYVSKGDAIVRASGSLFDASGAEVSQVSAGDMITVSGRKGKQYSVTTADGTVGYLPMASVGIIVVTPQLALNSAKMFGQAETDTKLYKDKTKKTSLSTIPEGHIFSVDSKTSTGDYNVTYNAKKGVVQAADMKLIGKGGKLLNLDDYIQTMMGAEVVIGITDIAAGIANPKYGGFTVVSAKVSAAEGQGTVRGSTVNMRASASASAKIIEQLPGGSNVTILGQSGDYYKVKSASGNEGYISQSFVNAAATTEARIGLSRKDNLNIRSSPSTTATSVGKLKKGERVTVTGSSGTFYSITTASGTKGYVADTYLSVQEGSVQVASSAGATSTNSESNSKNSSTSSSSNNNVIATGVISGGNINIRKSASSTSEVLGVAAQGSSVGIIASNNGYYRVNYNGTVGYILSTYIPSNTIVAGSSGSATTTTQTVSSQGSTTVSSGATATVTASTLNVRTESGSTVIGKLKKGDQVTVQSTSGSKAKIKTSSGTVGYVESQYLQKSGNASESTTSTSAGAGKGVATTGTNVRASASTSASKVTVIYKNESVEILGTEGEWLKVKANGKTGYVKSQYIQQ